MKIFSWKFLIVLYFVFSSFVFAAGSVSAATASWFHCGYTNEAVKKAFGAIKQGSPFQIPDDKGNISVKTVNSDADFGDVLNALAPEMVAYTECKSFSFDVDNCTDNSTCPFGYGCNVGNSKCEPAASGFDCSIGNNLCTKTLSGGAECICGDEIGATACKSFFCSDTSGYYCYENKCQKPGQPKPGPEPGSKQVAECVVGGKMLPALPDTVEGATSFWKGLGYSDVLCIKSEINLLQCSTSDDCAIGSYCYKDTLTGDKQCMLLASGKGGCETDTDCQTDFAIGGGKESTKTAYHCDNPTGICLYGVSTECDCPYGDSPAIKGYCNSPFCPITGEFGTAGSLGCNSNTNKCETLSTVIEESCKTHLDCWSGDGNVLFPKIKCCVKNKCDGDILQCKDDYAGVGKCPPAFKIDETSKTKCVYDCPESGNECNSDADCKKGGQNKFCVDITKDMFATDAENKLWACQQKGVAKRCSFQPAPAGTSSTPPVAPVSFSLPPTGGLNHLSVDSVPALIGNIIAKLMGVMGSIALVMFIYGGVLWMIAAGNAERSKKGMQIIVWSALGVMVILASYVIVSFVFEAFK